MRTNIPRSIALSALVLLSCGGCGAGAGGGSLVPVKGKITYKGQPLTKGLVVFEPRNSGSTATGELKSDGTFVLTTVKEGDGVVPGKHRVCISGTGSEGLGKNKKPKELIPAKFTQPNTSGLVAEVTSDKTEYNFDIP